MHQDRDVRRYAVPVRGTIWGVNYNDKSERDLGAIDSVPLALGDFHDFFPSYDVRTPSIVIPPQIAARSICPLRVLKPHYGELVECYADLQITVASGDSDLTLKLAVGRFESGSYDRVMTYSDDEINDSWVKIRGSTSPLAVSGGKITADLLDLLNALPVYGDSNYIDDAFVLILAFNKTPTVTGSFKFNFLNIHTSVTGAV